MEGQKLNEDLQSQIAEYVLKLSSFGLNILKKREANCQSINDLLDPNKWKGKNGYSLAKNRTRIQENRKNTFLKSSRQTRGRPNKQTLNDSLDAPADIDSEISMRSTRRAAQIAHMKNKSYMAIKLTKKLRRPTNIKATTSGSNRLSELVVSHSPPAKYRRTHKKQSAGSSYEKIVKSTQNVLSEPNTMHNEEGDIKVLENEIIENLNTKIISIQEKNDESQKRRPTRLKINMNITPTMEEKNTIKAMILNSVEKGSKSYKQLTSNAVVVIGNNHEIQKGTFSISDSGISEEENHCHSDHSNRCKKKNLRKPLCKNGKKEDVNEIGGTEEIEMEATKRQFRTKVVEKTVESKENEVDKQEDEVEDTSSRKRTKIIRKPIVRHEEDDKLDKREPFSTKTKTIKKDVFINDQEVDAEPLQKGKQIIPKDIATNEVELGFGKQISDVEPRNLKTRTKVISKPVLVVSNENNKTKEVSENENIKNEASSIRKITNLTKKVKSEDDIFAEANNSFNETRDVPEKNNTQSRNINTKNKNNLLMALTNGQVQSDDIMTSSEKSVNKAVTHPQSETVKKRVEEFEKINIIDKGLPVDIGCGRVTRTKTRAMVAASAVTDATVIVDQLYPNDVLQEFGKENLQSSMTSNHHGDGKSDKERVRGTPLANYNRVLTLIGHVDSSKKQIITGKSASSANRGIPFIHKTPSEEIKTKRKEEKIVKKKEKIDKATKNKEETLKATAEETRRKREEKLQKAAAAREVAEKVKAASAVKIEKEKEEKFKQTQLEKEKKLREEIAKKKLITHQKLLENEERRKQEEAARLAKIKEQEEEQKRLQANREKEQETAERLHQKRHLEELRAKEAEKLKKNKNCKLNKVATVNAVKLKMGVKTGTNMVSYEMTPDRDERPVLKPKRADDYGIDDAQTDDSSDDEKRPKKIIPSWAEVKNRKKGLYFQNFIPMVCWNKLMTSNPKPILEAIFSKEQLPLKNRQRTSSAVWSFAPSSSKMISS